MNVTDHPERYRFELPVDDRDADGLIAFINYHRANEVVMLLHAEVPAHLNGRGIGSMLVKGTLDLVRARGERMTPVCSFIRRYVQRHPEYQDLLA